MKIAILGSGYVGLTTGACLAELGHQVCCLDVDIQRVKSLENGKVPFFEKGLQDIVVKNTANKNIRFSHNIANELPNFSNIIIATNTPASENGSINLDTIYQCADSIGKYTDSNIFVITKSTVEVGTNQKIKQIILKHYNNRKLNFKVELISNPEFLRQGEAVHDFLHPDRIIVGLESQKAKQIMLELYQNLDIKTEKIIFMDIASAELTKYAANCFLATKITYMNQIANLCEKLGANIDHIQRGIGCDPRIGNLFIKPGIGYGGSCFPKDIKALTYTGKKAGVPMSIVEEVDKANEKQKNKPLEFLKKIYPTLKNKKVTILGLSFKANTDDLRSANSIYITQELIKEQAHIHCHDPKAMNKFKSIFKNFIQCHEDPYSAIKHSDALIILTEWAIYKNLELQKIKKLMNKALIIDGRNLYASQQMQKAGFNYFSIGRPAIIMPS